MSDELGSKIEAELSAMSDDEIRRALIELMSKQKARQASYNTPANKARRKEYYEAKKDTPEWKEARTRQAEARKLKMTALLNLAKSKFSAAELAELGIR